MTVAGTATQGSAELFEELPKELDSVELPQQSNIYDRTGKNLLATFYTQNRVVVPLEDISVWLQRAVVSIEDKRFMQHHGVDGEGLLRAAYVNLTSSSSPGASTLTQQLVKNTILQQAIDSEDDAAVEAATEVSLTRKIREWRLALAYEDKVDKLYGDSTQCTDEDPAVDCGKELILEQYLNIAQFGTNIYGAEAAAQYYFSKPAKDLNALEAATIAGITQNPSKWNPIRHPQNAQDRRDTVLLTMYEQGEITGPEFDVYTSIPIQDTLKVKRPKFSCVAAADAPFFCDYVTKIIKRDDVFNQEDSELSARTCSTAVASTSSPRSTSTSRRPPTRRCGTPSRRTTRAGGPWRSCRSTRRRARSSRWRRTRTSIPPPTPSTRPRSTTPSIASGAAREASRRASTFKPVILTQWLQSGHALMQTVDGREQDYKPESWQASCLDQNWNVGGGVWGPRNVEGARAYQQTVLDATANSVNTAYANMANQLDLCAIRDTAEELGFHRADGAEFEIVPSVTLGTQNASPLTMAQIAQVFANEGVRCDPIAILSVTDADGNALDVPQEHCERVIEKEIANGVAYAMQQVVQRGTGVVAQLADGRPAAGKTGTSQLNAHLWFMGYTPNLVATVWLGNPNQDEPGRNITLNNKFYSVLYGSSLSAPAWKAYMDKALVDIPVATFPDPTDEIVYGTPIDVPWVVGLTPDAAREKLEAAGFRLNDGGSRVYSTQYAPGVIISQSPSGKALAGSTIYYDVATDQRPDWWSNWPSGWDPNVAPDDWWGSEWPPAAFETDPPNGWPLAPEPTASPEPGNNGNGNGGGGGGGGEGN